MELSDDNETEDSKKYMLKKNFKISSFLVPID